MHQQHWRGSGSDRAKQKTRQAAEGGRREGVQRRQAAAVGRG